MTLKELIISLLEAIDSFSYPISGLFTFQAKPKHSTKASKALTIIILTLSTLSFFYFAQDVIYKSNPMTIHREQYNYDPDENLINSDDFFFSFALEKDAASKYETFVDETVYEVEASFVRWNKELFYEKEPLELELCNPKNFSNSNNSNIILYCIKNYSKIRFKGTWDSEEVHFIQVDYKYCRNKTKDNQTCQSYETLREKIEGAFTRFYYKTALPDLNDYYYPIKTQNVMEAATTSLKMATRLTFYFGLLEVETDVGFISKDLEYQRHLAYSKMKFEQYENYKDNTFLTMYVTLDPLSKITERKYDSLLNVISKTGGLLKLLVLLGSIFVKPFIRVDLIERVCNKNLNPQKFNENNTNESKNLGIWGYFKSLFIKSEKLNDATKNAIENIKVMTKILEINFLTNKLTKMEKNVRFPLENEVELEKFPPKRKSLFSALSKPKENELKTPLQMSEININPNEKPEVLNENIIKSQDLHHTQDNYCTTLMNSDRLLMTDNSIFHVSSQHEKSLIEISGVGIFPNNAEDSVKETMKETKNS